MSNSDEVILKACPPRGCQPVLEGQLPTVSDFGLASWNAWLRYRKAKQIGMKQLKAAVNEHKSFNALKSMQTIRFVDQVDEQSQLKITDVSCSLTERGIPIPA